MKTAYVIRGYLVDNSTIRLDEPLPMDSGDLKLVIEFDEKNRYSRKKMHGKFKGEIVMSGDFNEPLECFREYML